MLYGVGEGSTLACTRALKEGYMYVQLGCPDHPKQHPDPQPQEGAHPMLSQSSVDYNCWPTPNNIQQSGGRSQGQQPHRLERRTPTSEDNMQRCPKVTNEQAVVPRVQRSQL